MQVFFQKLDVARRLGALNIYRNLIYRLSLKAKLFKVMMPVRQGYMGDIVNFDEVELASSEDEEIHASGENCSIIRIADQVCDGNLLLFFYQPHFVGNPARWFYHEQEDVVCHWSEAPVNLIEGQDIKLTWDTSRFHWFQQLACAYSVSGDRKYLVALNRWFKSWMRANPVNQGVNWACGQEAGIRLIHMLNATRFLPMDLFSLDALVDCTVNHCRRIAPTIHYALSQDNNHGTSEAAALFIGGEWLCHHASHRKDAVGLGRQWAEKGRRILESRIARLVMEDGGFSMYSVSYHRVVLNTIAIVEYWRKTFDAKPFSKRYLTRCCAATRWLHHMVDVNTGDAPNLGANDGSNPFIVQSADYRDFRPSVQFAAVMFLNKRLYRSSATIDEPMRWLGEDFSQFPLEIERLESRVYPDFGMAVLRDTSSGGIASVGFIKYPEFKFRPSQADLLHFDLWADGVNLLRDGGSFSYNCQSEYMNYYSGIDAHNTLQVGDGPAMPRFGSFLFGRWPKMDAINFIVDSGVAHCWEGRYKTATGATHMRAVEAKGDGQWRITDRVTNTCDRVLLRWRLSPGDWRLIGTTVFNEKAEVSISGVGIKAIEIVEASESRYYNLASVTPSIYVESSGDNINIITTIRIF